MENFLHNHKTYKCVLVGLGRIAWRFDAENNGFPYPLTHMKTCCAHSRIAVVGGCSPAFQDRIDFEKKYGISVFTDIYELVESKHPDIVSICSPSEFHFNQIRFCLEKNIPMVWLEKPPTMTLDELDELILLQRKFEFKTRICVNYMRRYWGIYIAMKKIYHESILGKVQGINIFYSKGLDLNCSHFLDFVFYLLNENSDFKIIFGSEYPEQNNPSFLLEFVNGPGVFVSGFDLSYHTGDIILTCEYGRASILSGGMETRVEMKSENEVFSNFYRLKEGNSDILGEGGLDDCFSKAINDLITSYEQDREPKSNLSTSRNAQYVMDHIKRRRSKI